jgi:hypothetical protein
LRLSDVLAYQELRRRERRSTLDELAADAQELGAYEESPEFVEAALSEARRTLA